MFKYLIILLLPVICLGQDSKELRPLNVGDKVPNIPFNILKMGKTKGGKDTSWTEVHYLYDYLNGTDDKKPEPPPQKMIGILLPSDSVLIMLDCVPYEDSIDTIDPKTIRSITIYKGQRALDVFDYPSVIDIRTWDSDCDYQSSMKILPPTKRDKRRWWRFWRYN